MVIARIGCIGIVVIMIPTLSGKLKAELAEYGFMALVNDPRIFGFRQRWDGKAPCKILHIASSVEKFVENFDESEDELM